MSGFNEVYYVACGNSYEEQMRLSINKKSDGYFFYGELTKEGEPIFFEPSFQERNKKLGIASVKTDVMFDGPSFVVNNNIKKELDKYDLHGIQLCPAIVIESTGWDEGYWYLNIYQYLDCWDKDKSITRPLKAGRDIEDTKVLKYHLDKSVLNKIPENNRMIFKMGGGFYSHIFIHEKLVTYLLKNNITGIRFFKVSDFEEGMQI